MPGRPISAESVERFGLCRRPFSGFHFEAVYSYPCYENAYDCLLAGVRWRQRLIVLTGEAGTGKTLLLRKLMREAREVEFILCYSAILDFDELLSFIGDKLGLTVYEPSRSGKLKILQEYLNTRSRQGITVALLLDEAHNLHGDVLGHLLDLAQRGFRDGCSLQIVLVGLPLLEEQLARQQKAHPLVASAARACLKCLDDAQVADFIYRQLASAGIANVEILFPAPVIGQIAFYSRGNPRLINALCCHALLITESAGQESTSVEMIDEVADELMLSPAQAYKNLETGIVPPSVLEVLLKADSAPAVTLRVPPIAGEGDSAGPDPGFESSCSVAPESAQPDVAPASEPWIIPPWEGLYQRSLSSKINNNQPMPRRLERWPPWIALVLAVLIGVSAIYLLAPWF